MKEILKNGSMINKNTSYDVIFKGIEEQLIQLTQRSN
jgi:hypothetical protein